jgi:hypothetical protein
MHNRFLDEIRKNGLGKDVELIPSNDSWRNTMTGLVSFDLWHGIGQRVENRVAVPLKPSSDPRNPQIEWWLAWHEEWNVALKRFSFRTAGWAVFCAPPATGPLHLALRAEWGPLPDDEHSNSGPGQPHWHTHLRLPFASSEGDAGSPLNETRVDLALEGMHLAMGGWTHPEPGCWHHPLADDLPGKICNWAVATLAYLRIQIQEVRLKKSEAPASW